MDNLLLKLGQLVGFTIGFCQAFLAHALHQPLADTFFP
jgi:hypothetical protein